VFVNLYNATTAKRNPDFAPEYLQPWVRRFDETSAGATSNKTGSEKLRAFGLTLLSAAFREIREF